MWYAWPQGSWCRTQQPQRTESEAQPVEIGKDKKKVRFQGCKLNKRLDGLGELKRQLQAGETTVSAMSKTDVTDWLIIQNMLEMDSLCWE